MNGASDDTYRGLLEAAPDALVAIGGDGCVVFANAQAEQVFRTSREALIGTSIDALAPGSFERVGRVLGAGLRHHSANGARLELTGRRGDGSEFPAEISFSRFDGPDGPLVAAAVRDVTDRRRAEENFRGLLEAAPDAIVGVHLDGRIALANAQAERLFGYTREELIGRPVEMLVPLAARAGHAAHRAGYFADPRPRPMGAGLELAARRKDGTEFPAEISLSALDTEDGLLVSAAVRDVTERIEAQAERERLRAQAERERLERQLNQSQRLESLGSLAGGIAHDFNNLLGAILNYAAFVSEEVSAAAERPGGEAWQTVRDDVAQIQRAAERATHLTRQLLAFARREVVRPTVLNLNEVVAEVQQLLQRTIGEHVSLVTNLAADLWPLKADAGQIEQVLVNLAVNARDAMPTGGQLTIETHNVVVDDDYVSTRAGVDTGPHVRLRVSDTGCGMTRDVLDRVFEPFFSTKPKDEGSGLGMATVYGIITQASGYVQLYSEPGLGTTVVALFPVTPDAAGRDEAIETEPQRHDGRVLVVEDEDAIREVARRILARNGYDVVVARTPMEAVAIAESDPGEFRLLLTDVVMPGMLGKEVAERVCALRPGVRVLFMSGYAQPVLASQGTLDDGVVLVEKPFSERSLLEKIHEVLTV